MLHASDLLELLPHSTLAEYLNALLTYLHRLATIEDTYRSEVEGNVLEIGEELYVGRWNYPEDCTDSDVITTGLNQLLKSRSDFIARGIQTISRHRSSGLFRQHEVNFMHTYLIRFHLAAGSFLKVADVFNEMLGLELSRSNFYLINRNHLMR